MEGSSTSLQPWMVGLDLRRVGVAATIEVIKGLLSSKCPLVVMVVVVDIVLYKDVRSMKGLVKTMIGYLIRWYKLTQLLSCDIVGSLTATHVSLLGKIFFFIKVWLLTTTSTCLSTNSTLTTSVLQ